MLQQRDELGPIEDSCEVREFWVVVPRLSFRAPIIGSKYGRILASGSTDDTIILWDVASGQPLGEPLSAHTRDVNVVVFSLSPDGKTLASASSDNTIILWDVATRQPLGPSLAGHTGPVKGLAFGPDGQMLASGRSDSTVILWQLDLEPWDIRACRIANRNLTQAEWEEFIGSDIPYRQTCPESVPD